MTASLISPGAQWLAHCHSRPGHIQEQWELTLTARIPVGIRFDVLSMLQPLALTLLWELAAEAEGIPVLEEHAQRPAFHFLVRPGGMDGWPHSPDTTILTRGAMFTVPSPADDAVVGAQQHGLLWRTAPDGTGRVADPDVLRAALARARDPERQAARVRAARSDFWGSRHTR
ncbi:hypothetical protein [Streptomyces sp. VRA16 Mangrove soil]|uniref:hypothetical protein n=1 Tax=Streptomyces sp. VRA16 Mangrove soil TaxID=2817434 RepID=UPI001A9F1411|nr:hypothetical protein [Streptomyces sp. VRA16 Mangrove soil]MBO1332784.1 hypothetical protein [Streptomyces sp. VRA16 Mangrove soil]